LLAPVVEDIQSELPIFRFPPAIRQMNDPSTRLLFADAELRLADGARAPAEDAHRVAQAMALLWMYRPRTAIYSVLGLLGAKRADGRAFTQDDVKQAIRLLRERGWIDEMPRRDGYFRLHDPVRGRLYRELLEQTPAATLRKALCELERYRPDQLDYYWPVHDAGATVALIRIELFSGTQAKELLSKSSPTVAASFGSRTRVLRRMSPPWT